MEIENHLGTAGATDQQMVLQFYPLVKKIDITLIIRMVKFWK